MRCGMVRCDAMRCGEVRYVATRRVRRDITVILAGTYRLQHRHSTYNTTRFERVVGWVVVLEVRRGEGCQGRCQGLIIIVIIIITIITLLLRSQYRLECWEWKLAWIVSAVGCHVP